MKQDEIINLIKNGKNPQQLVTYILETQMSNTPMGANLLNLAKANKTGDIEHIVRNIFSQRGLDYDKELASFKQMLNTK